MPLQSAVKLSVLRGSPHHCQSPLKALKRAQPKLFPISISSFSSTFRILKILVHFVIRTPRSPNPTQQLDRIVQWRGKIDELIKRELLHRLPIPSPYSTSSRTINAPKCFPQSPQTTRTKLFFTSLPAPDCTSPKANGTLFHSFSSSSIWLQSLYWLSTTRVDPLVHELILRTPGLHIHRE